MLEIVVLDARGRIMGVKLVNSKPIKSPPIVKCKALDYPRWYTFDKTLGDCICWKVLLWM